MTTVAKPTQEHASHYYFKDGTPCYEVENKSKGGMRKTTLADAKKLGLLPSVTTILSILDRPALTMWKVEQGVLAALTTPRNPGEELDAFVYRVLHEERQQDQEAQKAMDRGTEIHNAIEKHFSQEPLSDEIVPWIAPAIAFLKDFGTHHKSEEILVSEDGFAGRTDEIQCKIYGFHIWDFKTTKKLPKGEAWTEHVLQLSAYAKAFDEQCGSTPDSVRPVITTGNIYISTVDQGKFVVCEHEDDWQTTYEQGFKPILTHWRWSTGLAT